MSEQQGRSDGGRPPGLRGAKPCRLCGACHWEVFEDKPGTGVWYGRAWDPAMKRAVKREAGSHGLALKVARKLKNEIEEGRFFPKPEAAWDPPFAEYIDDYVSRIESKLVDADGARRYARYWKAAPETKGKTMRQITRSDARKYRERRTKGGAPAAKRKRGPGSPSTLNKELSFARAVYNDFIVALEERNEQAQLSGRKAQPIPSNPFASSRIRRRKQEALYEPEPATRFRHLGSHGEDEADRLFAALPDLDAKRKVCAAALSGVDRGPMFAWKWDEDIDFVASQVRSWRRKGDGKLHVYWVPMVEDLNRTLRAIQEEQIARWGQRSRWVFPNAENSGPSDGRDFCDRVFQRALVRAGINTVCETTETKQVRAGRGWRSVQKRSRRVERTFRWKDLRHTFASWLRRRGAELDVIGALLGHRPNSPMTTRYAHLSTDIKHAAVRGLAGLIPTLPEMTTDRDTDRAPRDEAPTTTIH